MNLTLLKEADCVLHAIVANPSRLQRMDFPSNWYDGPFGGVIPYPKETVNITAALEPLSYQVATKSYIILLQFSHYKYYWEISGVDSSRRCYYSGHSLPASA